MKEIIYKVDAIDAVCRDCTIERKDKCKAEGYCYEVQNLKTLPSIKLPKGDLISRVDVLKYPIRLNHYDELNGTKEFVLGVESVIEYVESLPSAEAEWIPCSERLPRTGDDILVTFSDGEVDIIINARPKAWVKYEEANNLIFPVAWMPLPKPYREDGE